MDSGGSQEENPSLQGGNPPELTAQTEWQRFRERATTALLRGAAAGLALRGGLHLLSKAAALLSKGKKAQGSNSRHPFEETARYCAFLGSLGGVYVVVDEGIAALFGNERCSLTVKYSTRRGCSLALKCRANRVV